MNTRSLNRIVGIFAVMCLFATVGWATEGVSPGEGAFAQIPDGVSPGAINRTAEIEGRCPTFIWDSVPGAAFHELVGYRLPEKSELGDPSEVGLTNADRVLYAKVAGSAPAWEPELAECLTPGSSYVWFVRAVYREEDGEVAEASEWSYGRYFSISSMPSAGEVEEALRVLRRFGGYPVDPRGLESEAVDTKRPEPTGIVAARQQQQIPKSVTSAKTAIKGTVSDATGETYGVVGTSNSPDGAGVAAANTNGGPDLVLDGSEDYLPDAEFSQSGINRPWGTPQTFNIHNSTGLGMTLQVDGVDVVTTQSDLDSLGALSCGSGQIAKWTGSAWECLADDDTVLSEAQVDGYVADNGYSTGAHTVDTNTQLSEAQVDSYVANNGYSTGAHTVNTNLTEAQVDAYVADNGYPTISTGDSRWGQHPITVTNSSTTYNYLGSSISTCNTNIDHQVSITVPAAGTILLRGNVWITWYHTTGTRDQMILYFTSLTTGCTAETVGNWDEMWVKDIPSSYPSASGVYDMANLQRTITVGAAGTYTYYIGGYMPGGYTADTDRFWWANISATWHPN